MRNWLWLSIACGLLAGSVARGDFLITSERETFISGPYAGDDQITFRVQNTGTGLTSGTSKLLALDVTMSAYTCYLGPGAFSPPGHLFIHTYDADGSGINDDADFADLGGATPTLSYIRAGPRSGFTVVSTTPIYNSPDDPVAIKNPTAYSDGQSVSQFEVVGAPNLTTGGVDDRQPVVFAAAVVPHGEFVMLNGVLAAEAGAPVPIVPLLPVSPDPPSCPEPWALGAVIVPAVLLARRRSP